MRGRTIAAIVAAALLAGASGAAWLGWRHGYLDVHMEGGLPVVTTPSASPPAPAQSSAAPQALAQAQLTDTATRIAALEQRLAELNQQAIAAAGNATHAEALLLTFAARRSIERGQPLGWIEGQLRARFDGAQANAVDRVIAAAAAPVTLPQLSEGYTRLEPELVGGSKDEGTWDWFTREVGDLFVIRHDDMPSPTPQSRAARVREYLAGGKVEAALAEVERMPGKDAAGPWLTQARDYIATQRALDQLEMAALTGAHPVSAVTPAPTASASEAASADF